MLFGDLNLRQRLEDAFGSVAMHGAEVVFASCWRWKLNPNENKHYFVLFRKQGSLSLVNGYTKTDDLRPSTRATW